MPTFQMLLPSYQVSATYVTSLLNKVFNGISIVKLKRTSPSDIADY